MKLRVLDMLVCPVSGSDLHLKDATGSQATPADEASPPSQCRHCRVSESGPHVAASVAERDCAACYAIEIDTGRLENEAGQAYPIRNGVPRLLPDAQLTRGSAEDKAIREKAAAGKTIGASFGREWEHFDYDHSRTWHETVDDRCKLFLQEVDATADELKGKWVLDAGCGNGSLSRGLNRFGCEVLAADVADSVDRAYAYYRAKGNDRTHFVQADLMNPPFRHEAVDVLYSSGVLHHNPDTRQALLAVAKALAPGAKIYIWVYHKEPGIKFALQLKLRQVVSPMPAPVKHAFVCVWSVQSMIRQHIRTLLGLNDEKDRLTWRERIVDLLDIYTPRYRWMHTQDEVKGWYRELGFEDIKTTEVRDWGFGVVATKPGTGGGGPLSQTRQAAATNA
ncbi:MAG: methyltransferase domain-containing protein [Phycisphaeraceae bacterium]